MPQRRHLRGVAALPVLGSRSEVVCPQAVLFWRDAAHCSKGKVCQIPGQSLSCRACWLGQPHSACHDRASSSVSPAGQLAY